MQQHVLIAVPTFKDVPIEFAVNLTEICCYTQAQGYKVTLAYSQRTHRNVAREELISQAKELMVDFLFFLDDDMICEPDIIVRLIKDDVPIVSGLAFTRKAPFIPVILLVKYQTGEDGVLQEVFTPWYDYPINQLTPVAATGLACCLIRGDVLDTLSEFSCTSKEGAGEDVQMIRQAKFKGFQPYIDTRIIVGHLLAERIAVNDSFYNREAYKEHYANL